MKIKLYGINIRSGENPMFSDFMDYLITAETLGFDYAGFKRFLYVVKNQDHYSGLLITTKDQKKFMELSNEQGEITITARDVTEGAELAEFNFFIVDAITGRGLYQHYYHSCAFNQFGFILKYFFEKFKQIKIAEESNGLTNKRDLAVVKKKYANPLAWGFFMREESFDNLLARLAKIKSFDFTFSTVTVSDPVFRPLSGLCKQVSQKYSFAKNSVLSTVISAIKDSVSALGINDGKVIGVDENGQDVDVFLTDNLESFAEWDYDAVAEKMQRLNPREFNDAWLTNVILKKFNDQRELFSISS